MVCWIRSVEFDVGMARKLRLEYGGACYHVINRGNYRKDLFTAKGAAAAFQRCLFETGARFGWRLHAFVIMRNHFHLAVETPEPNLSEGMKWLQGTWVSRFNRFRGETGRPFQGRYKALHVEPGHALAQVAHYIHLNPVRANVTTCDELPGFRWSSLALLPTKKRPGCLEAKTVLAESGGLSDDAVGWKRYIDYLAVLAEEDARRREKQFGRLSRGWVIGSPQFKADLKQELLEKGTGTGRLELLGADRVAHREVRTEIWEEKLQLAARTMSIAIEQLPVRKSAPEKLVLAAVMKAATSVSNGWLAERLRMGKPASVSQFVRRFRLAGGMSGPTFQVVLSRVTT